MRLVLDVHELLARDRSTLRTGRRCQRGSPTTTPASSATARASQSSHASCCDAIPGVELVELPPDGRGVLRRAGHLPPHAAGRCGGSGRRQAQAIVATGAEWWSSADHGCIGQLQRHLRSSGSPIAVHHPLELLARALATEVERLAAHERRRSVNAQTLAGERRDVVAEADDEQDPDQRDPDKLPAPSPRSEILRPRTFSASAQKM